MGGIPLADLPAEVSTQAGPSQFRSGIFKQTPYKLKSNPILSLKKILITQVVLSGCCTPFRLSIKQIIQKLPGCLGPILNSWMGKNDTFVLPPPESAPILIPSPPVIIQCNAHTAQPQKKSKVTKN